MGYNRDVRSTANADGSFTVEAALIMPVIVGIIVLFIRLSFVCYDRVVIESICQQACIEAACEEDEISFVKEYISNDLEDKLICDWDTDISVYTENDHIIAEVNARTGLFPKAFKHTARANKLFCPKY